VLVLPGLLNNDLDERLLDVVQHDDAFVVMTASTLTTVERQLLL